MMLEEFSLRLRPEQGETLEKAAGRITLTTLALRKADEKMNKLKYICETRSCI